MNTTLLASMLTALGVFPDVAELRADDKFTAVLAKELEYVKTKTYDIRYPAFKARMLIPVSNEADTGAESITYRQWDGFGMAQIIANYADDITMVDALVEEFTSKVYGIAAGYQYSVQDLRRAALANQPLDQKRASFTRRAVEQKIEDIASLGETSTGVKGIANNPNVTLFSPKTGTWSTATGIQIATDMLNFVSQLVAANKETFEPTDLILSIPLFQRASTTPVSSTGDTSKTALQFFKEACPYPVTVSSWNKLRLANAAGTGPRAICYTKSPEVLTLEIPQEFEQFPPQQKNLAFVVPTHARIGGVIMTYPLAVGYMDGL